MLQFRSSRPSTLFDGHSRLYVRLSCKSLADLPARVILASGGVEKYLLQEETSRLGTIRTLPLGEGHCPVLHV